MAINILVNGLDYLPVIEHLGGADRDFTATHGCGGDHSLFDDHLKQAVVSYNKANGTEFDPFEALHLYLEIEEGKPWAELPNMVDVSVRNATYVHLNLYRKHDGD